jgi:hypothetical protein
MANIHITSALPPSNAAICGHWTRETAQKTAIRAVNPCSPKAEVIGSNPIGCTKYLNEINVLDFCPFVV